MLDSTLEETEPFQCRYAECYLGVRKNEKPKKASSNLGWLNEDTLWVVQRTEIVKSPVANRRSNVYFWVVEAKRTNGWFPSLSLPGEAFATQLGPPTRNSQTKESPANDAHKFNSLQGSDKFYVAIWWEQGTMDEAVQHLFNILRKKGHKYPVLYCTAFTNLGCACVHWQRLIMSVATDRKISRIKSGHRWQMRTTWQRGFGVGHVRTFYSCQDKGWTQLQS